jgi:hypothetical protein
MLRQAMQELRLTRSQAERLQQRFPAAVLQEALLALPPVETPPPDAAARLRALLLDPAFQLK